MVDEVLRLGAQRPDLLVLLREGHVPRAGGNGRAGRCHRAASGHRRNRPGGAGADPAAITRERRRLVAAGARVIATAVEAELLTQMGITPDRAWLRHRRRDLLAVVREG